MIKKLSSLIIIVCLVFLLTIPAFAAQVNLSQSSSNASVGDTVSVTVSLSGCPDTNAIGLSVSYNSEVLQLEVSSCKWQIYGLLSAFDPQTGRGVFAAEGDAEDLNGDIFVLTFKVIGEGAGDVSVEVIAKDDSTLVADITASTRLTSGAESHIHTFNVKNTASDYLASPATCNELAKYYYSCLCGEKSDRVFESGTYSHILEHVEAIEPDCENDGIIDHYKCLACKKTFFDASGTVEALSITASAYGYHSYEDGECIVCGEKQTHEHSFNSSWSHDEDTHWRECYGCTDVTDLDDHTPDGDGKDGEKVVCTVCGYVIKEAKGSEVTTATTESTTAKTEKTDKTSNTSASVTTSASESQSSETTTSATDPVSTSDSQPADTPAGTSSPEDETTADTGMSEIYDLPADDFSQVMPILIILGIISLTAVVLIILMIVKKSKR